MKWYTPLINGWSMDRDEATGEYTFGTIPHYLAKGYNLARYYIQKEVPSKLSSVFTKLKKAHSAFKRNVPALYWACASAAAFVGYFVAAGFAWGIASKILRLFKFFP